MHKLLIFYFFSVQSPAPARQGEEPVDTPDQNGHTELSDDR